VEPIKKIRLSDSVVNAIEKKVSENNFEPGDKFYSENELSRKLQVSRSSVREAIRILEAKGYITVRQGKGIFIKDFTSREFEPFVNWLKSNEEHILDHFEVRLIIEPKVAAFAAEKADARDTREMEETLKQFALYAESRNLPKLIKSDRDFHRRLASSTKNSTLRVLMRFITTSLPNGWTYSLHTPGRIEKTVQEHAVILEAVKNGDKKVAEESMRCHLENAVSDILSYVKKSPNKQFYGGPMSLKITTLIENNPGEHKALLFEHGLSFFIEKDDCRILFDTGQSSAYLANASQLKIDLSHLDYVVLSHGHYDHSGGFRALTKLTTRFTLLTGQGFFDEKYGVNNGTAEFIGNNFDETFLSYKRIKHQFIQERREEIFPVFLFSPGSPEFMMMKR